MDRTRERTAERAEEGGQRLARFASGEAFPGGEMLISAAEYVLAVGAIVNIVEMSIELGWRSAVPTWDCNSTWLPFAWVLFPGLIHILGAISFRRIPKSERASEGSGQRMALDYSRTPAMPRAGKIE